MASESYGHIAIRSRLRDKLSPRNRLSTKEKRCEQVSQRSLLAAWLRMVQITLLVSRGYGPVRSQEAFNLLDGQNRNKIFDVCPFLKLVCSVAQHPFNLGYWARELFS
jgi:hypothetical protein